ncbi:MAG: hypothetical protein ACFFE8_01315 [Candidatus Heimdallarchaeota archaeon]
MYDLVLDAIVLFFAIPLSMWNLRTFKKDKWNLAWIIPWSLLLFIGISLFEILLFIMGIILGYLTDIIGVFGKKWWYPHYSNRLYSLSAGYGWGIITLIIFRLYFYIIEDSANIMSWILLAVFLFLWISAEIVWGQPNLSNPWLIIRTVLTILFLLISDDILFLLVAAAGAVYLELLGTSLRIWIYYDKAPSYLHLGAGYAQLSYVCFLIANLVTNNIFPSVQQIIILLMLVVLYIMDYSGIKLSIWENRKKKTLINKSKSKQRNLN